MVILKLSFHYSKLKKKLFQKCDIFDIILYYILTIEILLIINQNIRLFLILTVQ